MWGLHGASWQEKSGFTRDPATLQIGETVGYANNTIISISGGIPPKRQNSEITGLQTYYKQKELPIGQSLDDVPQLFVGISGDVSFGLMQGGVSMISTTDGFGTYTSLVMPHFDIGIFNSIDSTGVGIHPGLAVTAIIGMSFPGNIGNKQQSFSGSLFGFGLSLSFSENGITSFGLSINTNAFNIDVNNNSQDFGISSTIISGGNNE